MTWRTLPVIQYSSMIWVCQRWPWCWWDCKSRLMFMKSWWQNFDLCDIFWTLVRDGNLKKIVYVGDQNGQHFRQHLKVVINTFRLQHRCNLYQLQAFLFQFQWTSAYCRFRFMFFDWNNRFRGWFWKLISKW